MSKPLTRKEFFLQGTKYLAGVGVGVAGVQALSGKTPAARTQYDWPWPYTTLDPEHVRKLGHDSFWTGYACAYGAFNAIIQALREAVGEPYTLLPTEMLIYGHGGGTGWGTLCGALNGSSAAISLVCTKNVTDQLVSELLGWYTQTKLPSDLSNQYAVNHDYSDNRYDQELPQNESGSPLCHVSVSEWCKTASHKVHDLERKERCARLAGDVAAHAVELLNDYYAGQFSPAYEPPASIAACMSCHGVDVQDNVLGKMECKQCHGEPHGTGVAQVSETTPSSYSVRQNYPNPFNPSTRIEFTLPREERVTLTIHNLNGRLVRKLVDGRDYPAGTYSVQWDGRDDRGRKVGSGMYFYRFRAGGYVRTRKMSLVE